MLKGGKHGPAIVPGKADESLLFQMAAHRVEPVMPPKDKKDADAAHARGARPAQALDRRRGQGRLGRERRARRSRSSSATLPPGVQPIDAVDMTADGTRVAAGRANVVQVYDVDSGLEIVSLGGHKDIIQSLRFSPDGRRLAAGSYQVVTLWNVPTGGLKATFTGHADQVKAVAVAARRQDGRLRRARQDGPVLGPGDGKPIRAVRQPRAGAGPGRLARRQDAWPSAGPTTSSASSTPADGKERRRAQGPHRAGRRRRVPARRQARSSRSRPTARRGSGRSPTKAGRRSRPSPLVLDGRQGPAPRRRRHARRHGRSSPAGDDGDGPALGRRRRQAARATIDGHGGPGARPGRQPRGRPAPDRLGRQDGAALSTSPTGKLRPTLGRPPRAGPPVAFRPTATAWRRPGPRAGVKVWDAATGQGVIAFGHTAPNNAGDPADPGRSPSRATAALVSASADKTLKSWTFEGPWSEMKPLGPHAFRVLALDFNPDGTLLAAGGGEPSRSGEVKLWEVGKGMLVRTLDGAPLRHRLRPPVQPRRHASSPRAAADKFLKVTRRRRRQGAEVVRGAHAPRPGRRLEVRRQAARHRRRPTTCSRSGTSRPASRSARSSPPASRSPPSAGCPARPTSRAPRATSSVRFWNPDNGERRPAPSAARATTSSASPPRSDGSRVAAGGADGVLFVWNGQNGQVIRKIEPPAPAAPRRRPRFGEEGVSREGEQE